MVLFCGIIQIMTETNQQTKRSQLTEKITEPFIEAVVPIKGDLVKVNHGYPLYSAIKQKIPFLQQCDFSRVKQIEGDSYSRSYLKLNAKSTIKLRAPISLAGKIYDLAGKNIDVCESNLFLGIPSLSALTPARELSSDLVIIKLKDEEFLVADRFLVVAERQLRESGISGRVSINIANGSLDKRRLSVKNSKNFGYSCRVSNLSEEDSIKLKILGLGGKRRMGAGWFE